MYIDGLILMYSVFIFLYKYMVVVVIYNVIMKKSIIYIILNKS